jgi:hypothetical protein
MPRPFSPKFTKCLEKRSRRSNRLLGGGLQDANLRPGSVLT